MNPPTEIMDTEEDEGNTIIQALREDFHRNIFRKILGPRGDEGDYLSNADSGSNTSIEISWKVADKVGFPLCEDTPSGQTAGRLFEEEVETFIQRSLDHLSHIRPGDWLYETEDGSSIGNFDQYEHLEDVERALEEDLELKASLGSDYIISPDVVVGRRPVPDDTINDDENLVSREEGYADYTPIRRRNNQRPILHGTVSCKWTIRSGRSQNSRTEALNLIRNRKGSTPHIVVVTAEPLPTRLSSIAMGTGDIDCTYHVALPELRSTLEEGDYAGQQDSLRLLMEGRRLRDISDLPFDLAI